MHPRFSCTVAALCRCRDSGSTVDEVEQPEKLLKSSIHTHASQLIPGDRLNAR